MIIYGGIFIIYIIIQRNKDREIIIILFFVCYLLLQMYLIISAKTFDVLICAAHFPAISVMPRHFAYPPMLPECYCLIDK